MISRLKIDPYLVLLMGMVALSLLLPVSGDAADALSLLIKGMIALLFFTTGIKLPREAVLAAMGNWRLHGLILGATYLLYPLIGLAAYHLLPALLTPQLWTGVLFLCALPSTIQSSVAYTAMAKGDVAGAVTAAAGSNIAGIAMTPALMAMLLSTSGGDAHLALAAVGQLALLMLLPFVLGQIIGPRGRPAVTRCRGIILLNDRGVILLAVYAAFSRASVDGTWSRLPIAQLALVLALCTLMLAGVMAALWHVGRWSVLPREGRIALLMCGAMKSLTAGAPIAAIMFHGPMLGPVLLPVLLYHQLQLVACTFIARRMGHDAPA